MVAQIVLGLLAKELEGHVVVDWAGQLDLGRQESLRATDRGD